MSKQEEKFCCECCWFYAEDTYGYGACPFQFAEVMRCDHKCNKLNEFVSKKQMRHHMAVLLLHNRSRKSELPLGQIHQLDTFEVGDAIDFAYKYMKVFSNL